MTASQGYKDLIQQLKLREDILRILVFTLFTVFCWVGFSIFQSQQKTKIPAETQRHAIPLNPNLNTTLIDEIEARKMFSEQELESFPILTKVTNSEGVEVITTLGDQTALVLSEGASATTAATPTPTPASTSATPDEEDLVTQTPPPSLNDEE